MASQSSLLYDELWMYKSDSDDFFSATVVYRCSNTSYSSPVSCVAVNYMDIVDHVDVVDVMLSMHTIKAASACYRNVWNFCSQVMAGYIC